MTEGILAQAIQKELQAKHFYDRVASKISRPNVKKMFEKMAKDEAGHAAVLSSRYNKVFNKQYTPVKLETPEKFKIAETEVYDIQTAIQIVSLAIGFEDESIQLYIKQYEQTEDAEGKKLIKKLVHFEMGHKLKLQNQHERLNKGHSWTGRD